jgi:hypothetical protein
MYPGLRSPSSFLDIRLQEFFDAVKEWRENRDQRIDPRDDAYKEEGYRERQTFNQEMPPNAVTDILGDFTSMMTLFEGANNSTPFHELMHHMLNIQDKISTMDGVADWMKNDHLEMMHEFGVTQDQFRNETLLSDVKNLDNTARSFLRDKPDITVREYVFQSPSEDSSMLTERQPTTGLSF